MIRRLFSIVIFSCTILTASFGQDVVGRDAIRSWAENLRKTAPERGKIAWRQTDLMMAQLAPQAGAGSVNICTRADPLG